MRDLLRLTFRIIVSQVTPCIYHLKKICVNGLKAVPPTAKQVEEIL